MWSVVHLPFALINTTASVMFLPFHGLNGSSNCKHLPTVRLFDNFNRSPVCGWRFKTGILHIKTLGQKSKPFGSSNFASLLPRSPTRRSGGLKESLPAMAMAVTISSPRRRKRACSDCHRCALREVAVEASDNGILPVGVVRMSCPLTDAGSTCVREHHTTHTFKSSQNSIALCCVTHLFTTGGNGEFATSPSTFYPRLVGRWIRLLV